MIDAKQRAERRCSAFLPLNKLRRSITELIKNKDHLTSSGLDKIQELKKGMNRGRNSES